MRELLLRLVYVEESRQGRIFFHLNRNGSKNPYDFVTTAVRHSFGTIILSARVHEIRQCGNISWRITSVKNVPYILYLLYTV